MNMSVFEPHPLDILHPGDIRLAWCSKSGVRERKLWTGHKFICLHCHPECDPVKPAADGGLESPKTPQEAL